MYNYQAQIDRLKEEPSSIYREWNDAEGLFKFIGDRENATSGCLTMIRRENREYKAIINGWCDEELTNEIKDDERIPKDARNIGVEHLEVFREWQERLDKLQKS